MRCKQLCLAIGLIIMSSFAAKAQVISSNYSFLRQNLNQISDSKQLDSLFAKLLRIENGSQEIVNIFHLGDSHIQGDGITGEIRRLLQAQFGNAGRGTIFPYKAARTNGSESYSSSFGGQWQVNKAILPIKDNTNGLAAYSISSSNPGDYILFDMKNCHIPDSNTTKQLLIFNNKENMGFELKLHDWTNNRDYMIEHDNPEKFCSVAFDMPSCQWGIENTTRIDSNNETIYRGIVALSGSKGVLYHNIGVNGLQAFHYVNNAGVFSDIKVLSPDLLILSLGTNEAQDFKRSEDLFAAQMDSLIELIQHIIPGCPIIITTPLESFKWNRPNRLIAKIAYIWKETAIKKKLMCWDLFQIAGGINSSYRWIRSGLFSRDNVHQSPQGYKLQGALFYEALMKDYENFKNLLK